MLQNDCIVLADDLHLSCVCRKRWTFTHFRSTVLHSLRSPLWSDRLVDSLPVASSELSRSKLVHVQLDVTHKPLNLCLYTVFTYLEWRLQCELVLFHFVGLCGHHSWSWWNNGSFWLSVSDGNVRSCLHSKFYQVRKSGDLLTHCFEIINYKQILPIQIHKINETGSLTVNNLIKHRVQNQQTKCQMCVNFGFIQ